MWQKQQTSGELDDGRIVDGVAGERNIYRRRAPEDPQGTASRPRLPKRVKFVLDVSGSMYTFNRIDKRLDKLCELCVFIMEAFEGLEQQFKYAVVGHSGSGPEALKLIPWGRPPSTPKEKLRLVEELRAHAQYCNPGDATLDGTKLAIADCLAAEGDEHFVFVISDADLERYGITRQRRGTRSSPPTRAAMRTRSSSRRTRPRQRASSPASRPAARSCATRRRSSRPRS